MRQGWVALASLLHAAAHRHPNQDPGAPSMDGLGKMACVCSVMKGMASDEQLWEKRYGEVLGEVDVAGAWEKRWKDKFGASIRRKKMTERDMARTLVAADAQATPTTGCSYV